MLWALAPYTTSPPAASLSAKTNSSGSASAPVQAALQAALRYKLRAALDCSNLLAPPTRIRPPAQAGSQHLPHSHSPRTCIWPPVQAGRQELAVSLTPSPASGRQRMLFLKLSPATSAGSSCVSTSAADCPTCFTSTHTYSTPLASASLKQSSTAGGRSAGQAGECWWVDGGWHTVGQLHPLPPWRCWQAGTRQAGSQERVTQASNSPSTGKQAGRHQTGRQPRAGHPSKQ